MDGLLGPILVIIASLIGIAVLNRGRKKRESAAAAAINVKRAQDMPKPPPPAEPSMPHLMQVWGMLSILEEKIGAPGEPFHLPSALFDTLHDGDFFSQESLNSLARAVLAHMRIPGNVFVVAEITGESRFATEGKATAGSYSRKEDMPLNMRVIRVKLRTDYFLDHVVAIMCHECAHHYHAMRGILFDKKWNSEEMTDATAVYLGFGGFMLRGYRPIVRETKTPIQNGTRVTKQTSSIGYLSADIIDALDKEVERLRGQYRRKAQEKQAETERAKARHAEAAQKAESLPKKIQTAQFLFDNFKQFMTIVGRPEGVISPEDAAALQACFYEMETGAPAQALARMASRCAEYTPTSETLEQLTALETEIEAFCTKIALWSACLSRCGA